MVKFIHRLRSWSVSCICHSSGWNSQVESSSHRDHTRSRKYIILWDLIKGNLNVDGDEFIWNHYRQLRPGGQNMQWSIRDRQVYACPESSRLLGVSANTSDSIRSTYDHVAPLESCATSGVNFFLEVGTWLSVTFWYVLITVQRLGKPATLTSIWF